MKPDKLHLLLLLALIGMVSSAAGAEGLVALPNAHSMAPLFNRFMQLPNLTGVLPDSGRFFFAPSLSIAQGQTNTITQYFGNVDVINRLYDFEVYSLELPLEYGLDDNNALGVNLQLYCYAGGFMDAGVAAFHNLFGFPNNSRDKIPNNQLLINLDAGNGFHLYSDSPRLSVVDPLVWWAYKVYADQKIQIKGNVLLSLPLGLSDGLGGNRWPQLGLAIGGLWEPSRGIVLYANSLLNLPFDSFGYAGMPWLQFQSRSGLLFALGPELWCGIDFHFRSSPLGNVGVALDYGNTFNQPALDLLVSLLWIPLDKGPARQMGSFSMQEDPISHNASDFQFVLGGAFEF